MFVESGTKSDIFSLTSLISWLEKQPANESYCYTSFGYCMLAKYFTDMGFKNVMMTSTHFWHGHRDRVELPEGFDLVARADGVLVSLSYGAALKRAKAFLSTRSK